MKGCRGCCEAEGTSAGGIEEKSKGRARGSVMHQTGLVQSTWKITSILNDPDVKDEHDRASS